MSPPHQRCNESCPLLRNCRKDIAADLRWDPPVIEIFTQHWKYLKYGKEESAPETPKMTKTHLVIKWTEPFADSLDHVTGTRTIPLSNVIHEDANAPNVAPALATNQPYGAKFGLVEGKLIAHASHSHTLFHDDNATVYCYLKK